MSICSYSCSNQLSTCKNDHEEKISCQPAEAFCQDTHTTLERAAGCKYRTSCILHSAAVSAAKKLYKNAVYMQP
jgi:hypothetical protein